MDKHKASNVISPNIALTSQERTDDSSMLCTLRCVRIKDSMQKLRKCQFVRLDGLKYGINFLRFRLPWGVVSGGGSCTLFNDVCSLGMGCLRQLRHEGVLYKYRTCDLGCNT